MLKAVLFDFGGVLTESCWDRIAMADIVEEALKSIGISVTTSFRQEFMNALDDAWERVTRTLLEERMENIILDAARRAGIQANIDHAKVAVEKLKEAPFCIVRREAKQTLQALKDMGLKLGIVSNSPVNFHENVLARHSLREYLDVVVVSCEVGYRKPHPQIFRIALEALNVEPRHAIYVGDIPQIDVPGARKLGMKVVLISTPEPAVEYLKLPKNLDDTEPDYMIDNLLELIDIVKEFISKFP